MMEPPQALCSIDGDTEQWETPPPAYGMPMHKMLPASPAHLVTATEGTRLLPCRAALLTCLPSAPGVRVLLCTAQRLQDIAWQELAHALMAAAVYLKGPANAVPAHKMAVKCRLAVLAQT